MGELKKWRKISQLSVNEIEQISIENLRKILTDCVHNVPYYKEFSNEENLNTLSVVLYHSLPGSDGVGSEVSFSTRKFSINELSANSKP